jgi:hypothetical protein
MVPIHPYRMMMTRRFETLDAVVEIITVFQNINQPN